MSAKTDERVPFEFPESGKKIYLPSVTLSALVVKLQRRYPRPKPPRQQVDYGDRKVWEFNYSDPDYQRQVVDWEDFVQAQAMETAFARLYRFSLNPEQQEELEAWKADPANEGLWDESESDAALYLEEIAISSDSDFRALVEHIRGPSQEVIAAVQDGFQGEIQGQRSVEDADT